MINATSTESKLETLIAKGRSQGTKKIALINPPSFFLTDDKVFFSLGLLSVAGVAKQAGHEVELFDLAGHPDYEARAQEIARKGYDIYGLTATSPQFSYASHILRAIKEQNPSAHVVVGGPHATMFAHLRRKRLQEMGGIEERIRKSDPNFASLEHFDQIVEGEEYGLLEVANNIEKPNQPQWVYSGVFEDLDRLPFLPRELIDMEGYTFKKDGSPKFAINGGPATSVISQRGCPFGCNFCSGRGVPQYRNIKVGGKIRAYSPERIVTELEHTAELIQGVTGFMFYDDELNLHPPTTLALLSALEENNIRRRAAGKNQFSFRGFVKSELLVKHPEVLEGMVAAGFTTLLSGFESGSERILTTYVKKNTTPTVNYEAARLILKSGIELKALTMLGNPTETRVDAQETERFLRSVGDLAQKYRTPWDFDITILTPYPGASVYDDTRPNKGNFRDEFERVHGEGWLYVKETDFGIETAPYKTAPGENVVRIRTPTLSSSDLFELRQEIDDNIRKDYHLHRHDREARERNPVLDVDRSMGQS